MDKSFRPLETNDLWPEDEPVSSQIGVTEERNRQATETRDMLVPNLTAILLHLEVMKVSTKSKPPELLRCTGSLKNSCLFFESSEFRTSCNQARPSRYPLKLSTFCISEAVGMATAKPTFVCELHSTR